MMSESSVRSILVGWQKDHPLPNELVYFLRRKSLFLQNSNRMFPKPGRRSSMARSFSIKAKWHVDHAKVWNIGMRHFYQHLESVKLRVVGEIGDRTDAATRDRLGTKKILPFRRRLRFEASL